MIAILLARRGIKAGRLDMAIGLHADPDIGIGRRHAQLPDPRQLDAVLQRAAVRQQILKPPPPPDARDTRLLVAGIDQAGDTERRAILGGADQDRGPEAAGGLADFCGCWIIQEKPGSGGSVPGVVGNYLAPANRDET